MIQKQRLEARFIAPMVVAALAAFTLFSCKSAPPPAQSETAPAQNVAPPAAVQQPETNKPAKTSSDEVRQKILATGEQFIDQPYHTPPNVPKSFDCSGFV
jgi:cell wall-associated NlpC family hydrolase